MPKNGFKNRPIKFRAWRDVGNGREKMLFSDNPPHPMALWAVHTLDSDSLHTIMQFTGLYDKEGIEIYEGDILELDDIVCIVIFNDGGFHMATDVSGHSPAVQDSTRRFNVVGNIFEGRQ